MLSNNGESRLPPHIALWTTWLTLCVFAGGCAFLLWLSCILNTAPQLNHSTLLEHASRSAYLIALVLVLIMAGTWFQPLTCSLPLYLLPIDQFDNNATVVHFRQQCIGMSESSLSDLKSSSAALDVLVLLWHIFFFRIGFIMPDFLVNNNGDNGSVVSLILPLQVFQGVVRAVAMEQNTFVPWWLRTISEMANLLGLLLFICTAQILPFPEHVQAGWFTQDDQSASTKEVYVRNRTYARVLDLCNAPENSGIPVVQHRLALCLSARLGEVRRDCCLTNDNQIVESFVLHENKRRDVVDMV